MASLRKGSLRLVQVTANNLQGQANELTHVNNYDQRKRAEERRLTGMSELLQVLARRLEKECLKQKMDEAAKNTKGRDTAVKQRNKSDEEDEDSEEDDKDESDNDEDVESDDNQYDIDLFVTISDFQAQEEHDLSFKKGEVIRILNQSPDGWWLGVNAEGKEGVVPKTYLQVYSKQSQRTLDNIENDEEDEEDEDDEEDEEDEDEEGDEAKRQNMKRKVHEVQSEESRSHKLTAKKVVSEITAVDMLVEKGAIPAGFRASTLSQLLTEGNKFHMSYFLQPTLTQSKLYFKDLHWDQSHGGVRPKKTHVELLFTLWSCKMIPLPVSGVQVLSRNVRCCLFDGLKVVSNIHTIRATWQPKNPKTWTFSPRVTGILPSLLDGECFVRSNSQSPDIGILFEVGISYIYSSTGHRGELSCGWGFLPLFTADGTAIPHRTYEIVLNGGTPYEKGLEVDPVLSRRANFFEQIIASRKQPKLLVKLKAPFGQMRHSLNLLPETLVGPKCYVHLLAFYRQLLAEALLKDRINLQSADLICNPVLATFSEFVEQTDIVDALRSAWSEKELTVKRSEKRDAEFMRHLFVQVYHDSVYPLLRSSTFPANKWADEEVEVSRWKDIANFLQQTQEKNGSLYSLLSPEHTYHVFDISEVFGGLVWILVASSRVPFASNQGWLMFVSVLCFVVTTVLLILYLAGVQKQSSTMTVVDVFYHFIAAVFYLSVAILETSDTRFILLTLVTFDKRVHNLNIAATVFAYMATLMYTIHAILSIVRWKSSS